MNGRCLGDYAALKDAAQQVAALKAAGRAILTECLKDKTLRESRPMVEGYYLLGDYAAQKEAALKYLARAKAEGSATKNAHN